MKNILLLIIVFLFCANTKIEAQNTTDAPEIEVPVIARAYSDSIILRWAVSQYAGWDMANEEGYTIKRAEILSDTEDYENLNFTPIYNGAYKGYSLQQFEEYFNTHDENHADYPYMFTIYTMQYEKGTIAEDYSVNIFDQDLNSIKDERNKANYKLIMSLFASDASFRAAQAGAMGFVDKNVEEGKVYVYQVSLNGKSDVYIKKDGYVKVKCEPFNPDKYLKEIYTNEQDQQVMLGWPNSGIGNAYFVERSTSENGEYERLMSTPKLVQANDNSNASGSYLDDSLVNYTRYYYRIVARSFFGDEILVGTGSAMPRDFTPPNQPFLSQPIQITPTEVELNWTMPGDLPSDFAGFNVGRGHSVDGPFIKVHEGFLPGGTTKFIDTSFVRGTSNFYVIQALDTAANFNLSRVALVTLIDSIPPDIPKFLKGEVDSLGVVTLYLERNKATDLMGYRVFKANSLNDEPSTFFETYNHESEAIAKDTVIIDSISLGTLTKNIYYYATALDYHYNESKLSEPIKIVKPDTIPPVKPFIGDYFIKESQIELELIPSPSSDVVGHLLYRQVVGKEDELTVYMELPLDANYFIDSNIVGNQKYIYGFTAIDDSDLESDMNTPMTLKTYRLDSLPSVEFAAAYVEQERQVVLNWEYNHNIKEDYTFRIYKKPAGQNWEFLTTVKKGENYKVIDKLKGESESISYRISVSSKYLQSLKNRVVDVIFN